MLVHRTNFPRKAKHITKANWKTRSLTKLIYGPYGSLVCTNTRTQQRTGIFRLPVDNFYTP